MNDGDKYPNLFKPASIGGLSIKNRTVMLPMGTRIPTEGIVDDADIAWHRDRAMGGVGLIITGGTIVDITSASRDRNQGLIEAWRPDGLEKAKQRVSAVQVSGCRIFGQILHLGRETVGGQIELPQLAPSPIRSPREPFVPHEMSKQEIDSMVMAFTECAALYQEAGHDGLEIHAAHGYLIAQFLSELANQRTDSYGGANLENRIRFLKEILVAVRSRCGNDWPVGVRLSADEEIPGGIDLRQTLETAESLQNDSLIDYISVTVGVRGAYVKDNTHPLGVAVSRAAEIKKIASVPVIVAGRIKHPELAEQIISDGLADFVGLGRALIADPEWVSKVKEGRTDEVRPCIGCVQDCRTSMGGALCAVNASAGRELSWGRGSLKSKKSMRVVIVGGGPGGLEAARVAAEQGSDVVLYERTSTLGGQVQDVARAPFRSEMSDFIGYLEKELIRLRVEIRREVEATSSLVSKDSPDVAIIATGSVGVAPSIVGGGLPHVLTVWELFDGTDRSFDGPATVIDDGTGFWPACSAAEFLASQEIEVSLVTPAQAIGMNLPHESIGPLHKRLRSHNVQYRCLSRLESVDHEMIEIVDTFNGASSAIPSRCVVIVTPRVVCDALIRELNDLEIRAYGIGDCLSPRRISQAMFDANRIVRSLA